MNKLGCLGVEGRNQVRIRTEETACHFSCQALSSPNELIGASAITAVPPRCKYLHHNLDLAPARLGSATARLFNGSNNSNSNKLICTSSRLHQSPSTPRMPHSRRGLRFQTYVLPIHPMCHSRHIHHNQILYILIW